MNTNIPFLILSAEHDDRSKETNALHTLTLSKQLEARGLEFKQLSGCHEGHENQSFIIFANDPTDALYHVMSFARRYSQETILYVDANRKACLYHTDWGQKKTDLGFWRNVDKDVAMTANSWSCVLGQYYITRNY